MASRKATTKPPAKDLKSSATSQQATTTLTGPKPTLTHFPLARYTSVLGVHTSLLTFTALFLPRTSLDSLVDFLSNREIKKPHALRKPDILEALTQSPPRTLAWICFGTFILQLWWAVWMRSWYFESNILKKASKDTDQTVERMMRSVWNAKRLTVGCFSY